LYHAYAPGVPIADRECEVYGATGRFPPFGLTVKAEFTGDPNALGWQQLDARGGHERSYFIKPGFSGSPVRDPLTKATWGMVTAVLEEPDRMAFAIPAEILRAATDAVTVAARQRHQAIAPPAQRAPGPLDQLAREALASLLGEQLPEGDIEAERIEDLRRALSDLAERARKPAARSSIAEALERLKEGEKGGAEAIFADIVADKETQGAAAYREAAEAARHLGALASLDNTAKAIAAYATATRLDPDHTWSWIFLGRLYQQAGDLNAAERAFREARKAAERAADERDVMVTCNELGGLQMARGRLSAALASYNEGLAIAQRLVQQDPGNAEWQRDLSVSLNKIGDVQRAQGEQAGALKAYRDSLAIAEKLAAQDPGNAEWQRDLSVSFIKIGEVQSAKGDLEGALEAYRDSLAILEKLAAQDPGNALWQRDLSVSFDKIGEVQSAQGDLDGALKAYRDSLAILEKLAAQDPGNADWQRDLIVSHWKLADLSEQRREAAEARSHWQAALAIARELDTSGRLAPTDAYFVGTIEERLARAGGAAAR
jgi:tetratricopeptide (TPR) repeat protein